MSIPPPLPQPYARSSKYAAPALPPGFLRRARLLDFLHQNINRRLLLIAAAAGYGKTSLVADFAGDTEFPVAWLALDESDRAVTALAADIVAALGRLFPDACETTRALLDSGGAAAAQPEQTAAALAADMEGLPAGYFVLCLDDYHVVADSEPVGRFMMRLLNLLPEQAHLIITSRSIPPHPFPIVPLAARQQIAGLSEEQLRFTPHEIQALLQARNNVAMPAAEAEQLAANTEGWITGILLSSHLMWQGLMASWLQAQEAGQPVYDYLADEVLGRLPPALRDFLLESAALPEMDAEACDAVLGRTDSEAMLRLASDQRLFITRVGDEAPAFRYHQLFRDFLLDRLRARAPERLREIQRRAADWYARRGWPEAAVTFFLAAGDVAHAAQTAEVNARALMAAGSTETLLQWGEQFAQAGVETPRLLLYQAKALTDAGDLGKASATLALAEQAFRRQEDAAGLISTGLQHALLAYREGHYARALEEALQAREQAQADGQTDLEALADRYAGLAHLALGELGAAAAALERAVAALERIGDSGNQGIALQDLARVYKAAGKTALAVQAQQTALAIWRRLGRISSLAFALNNLAWDKHMLGQYQDAQATYAEALALARRAGSGPAEILVLTGQGDLLADLGDYNGANEFYERAIRLVEALQEAGYLRYLYQARARLERRTGNFAGALEWLRRAETVPISSQAESPGTNTQVLEACIALDLGRTEEAIAALEQTCNQLEEAGAVVDLAAAHFCLARARFLTANQDAAFASLRRAFELAEGVGYDQMLAVEAEWAHDLLEAAAERRELRERAEGLLGRARAAKALARQGERRQPPADQRPAEIEVRALGGSRVRVRGQEVPRSAWASQQPRELFLYLVDHAPVRKEDLLDLFWRAKNPARATANLHQALYQARRAVGREAIVLGEEGYRLDPGLYLEYDVAQFEQSARAALALPLGSPRRAAALEMAANLYGGEYLADLPLEWAQSRRQALSALHQELLRQLGKELHSLARFAEARDVLARALEHDPCDDDLNEWLLRCLAGLGRRHEVVAHYQRYRERLRTELGIDPPPEIRELYARLIA